MSQEERYAERSVLGSLLRDNAAIAEVAAVLTCSDFEAGHHGDIWRASLSLWDAGKPVDLVTVADELHRAGKIEGIGGYPYLAGLLDAAPSATNVLHYAAIVRERSILRQLRNAAAAIAAESANPSQSATDALEEAERRIFAIAQVGMSGGAVTLADGVNECLDRLDARAEQRSSSGAVLTGFADLDRLTCGLQAGELIVLAARPSVGKTAFSLGIARHAVQRGQPVFFASLEQPRVDLAERLLCCEAQVDSYRLRHGRCSDEEKSRIATAAAELRKLPLHIDDAANQSMLRISANVRRLKLKAGIKLAVVDYLQLIEPEDRKANRQEQVAAVSRRLKHLAREAKIPVLCLAQLNREVEHRKGERPRLADLRDSGEIEQNADTVLLLHRPESADAENRLIEVILAKQRNGPTGEETLLFRQQFLRFENYAPETPETPGSWRTVG